MGKCQPSFLHRERGPQNWQVLRGGQGQGLLRAQSTSQAWAPPAEGRRERGASEGWVREIACFVVLPLAGLELKASRVALFPLVTHKSQVSNQNLQSPFTVSDKLQCLFELQGIMGRD